jgi:hypothetical protein
VTLPEFDKDGNLPVGVYRVTLREAVAHFGTPSPHRIMLALRLERMYRLAVATGQLARFIVFGSFITAKPVPRDVDVFMLMEDTFDAGQLSGETAVLFNHMAADAFFGCSVFWLRRMAALDGEQAAVQDWQHTREQGRRGIVEIIPESP